MRIGSGVRRLFPLFQEIGSARWEGETTCRIDRTARRFCQRHGLTTVMTGYRGYPAHSSVSVNDIAVHGVPGDRMIQRGDIFTVDVAARGGGWVSDSAWTYLMPGCSDRTRRFYLNSWSAFRELLVRITPGISLYTLAETSQEISDAFGLTVLPDFVGHGIGRELHESPVIPFALQRADSGASEVFLNPGATVNIEPVYAAGGRDIVQAEDGWGFRTSDGSVTSHFELTLLICTDRVEVLQFGSVDPSGLPAEPPFGLLSG